MHGLQGFTFGKLEEWRRAMSAGNISLLGGHSPFSNFSDGTELYGKLGEPLHNLEQHSHFQRDRGNGFLSTTRSLSTCNGQSLRGSCRQTDATPSSGDNNSASTDYAISSPCYNDFNWEDFVNDMPTPNPPLWEGL